MFSLLGGLSHRLSSSFVVTCKTSGLGEGQSRLARRYWEINNAEYLSPLSHAREMAGSRY